MLDDAPARLATTAERALLRRIEGGCQVPLGALATLTATRLNLYAAVCALDGSRMLSAEGSTAADVESATALGESLAENLLSQGAGSIIEQQRGGHRDVESP